MAVVKQKSLFTGEIEQALKHFQDVQWLGEQSPLASPYFLGARLPVTALDPMHRGAYLQTLLTEITDLITGRYAARYQTIIREYYFNNRTVKAVCEQISLGHNLIEQFRPAIQFCLNSSGGKLLSRLEQTHGSQQTADHSGQKQCPP